MEWIFSQSLSGSDLTDSAQKTHGVDRDAVKVCVCVCVRETGGASKECKNKEKEQKLKQNYLLLGSIMLTIMTQ